jgi:hypothetical protein
MKRWIPKPAPYFERAAETETIVKVENFRDARRVSTEICVATDMPISIRRLSATITFLGRRKSHAAKFGFPCEKPLLDIFLHLQCLCDGASAMVTHLKSLLLTKMKLIC